MIEVVRRALALVVLFGCGRVGFTDEPSDLVWRVEQPGTSARLYDVWASGSEVVAIGDAPSPIRRGADGTWLPDASPYATSYYAINGIASDLFVAGNTAGSGMAIMRDRGAGWAADSNAFSAPLNGVWRVSATDIYVAGYDGIIGHSAGDGTWIAQTAGTAQDLFSLWASSATDIYLVGDAGTILHSTGDGSWQMQPSGTTECLIGIWGFGPANIYVVGHGGVILHSTGDGTWQSEPSGRTLDLYRVWGTSPANLFALGEGDELVRSTGDGTWTPLPTGTGAATLEAIAGEPDDLYIVGSSGLVLHGTR